MISAQRLDIASSQGVSARISAGVGAIAMLGGAGFVALNDPTRWGVFPACPLLALTGYACPGCGLTRAFHALFRGDVIPAIDFNLLVPVWAVVFGYIVLALFIFGVFGKSIPMWLVRPKFLWSFLIVLISFGILRNIPSWPFTILYP